MMKTSGQLPLMTVLSAASYKLVPEVTVKSASLCPPQTVTIELQPDYRDGAILPFELADKRLKLRAPHDGKSLDMASEEHFIRPCPADTGSLMGAIAGLRLLGDRQSFGTALDLPLHAIEAM